MAGLDDYRNYVSDEINYPDFSQYSSSSGSLLPPSQPSPYQFPVPLSDEGKLIHILLLYE